MHFPKLWSASRRIAECCLRPQHWLDLCLRFAGGVYLLVGQECFSMQVPVKATARLGLAVTCDCPKSTLSDIPRAMLQNIPLIFGGCSAKDFLRSL